MPSRGVYQLAAVRLIVLLSAACGSHAIHVVCSSDVSHAYVQAAVPQIGNPALCASAVAKLGLPNRTYDVEVVESVTYVSSERTIARCSLRQVEVSFNESAGNLSSTCIMDELVDNPRASSSNSSASSTSTVESFLACRCSIRQAAASLEAIYTTVNTTNTSGFVNGTSVVVAREEAERFAGLVMSIANNTIHTQIGNKICASVLHPLTSNGSSHADRNSASASDVSCSGTCSDHISLGVEDAGCGCTVGALPLIRFADKCLTTCDDGSFKFYDECNDRCGSLNDVLASENPETLECPIIAIWKAIQEPPNATNPWLSLSFITDGFNGRNFVFKVNTTAPGQTGAPDPNPLSVSASNSTTAPPKTALYIRPSVRLVLGQAVEEREEHWHPVPPLKAFWARQIFGGLISMFIMLFGYVTNMFGKWHSLEDEGFRFTSLSDFGPPMPNKEWRLQWRHPNRRGKEFSFFSMALLITGAQLVGPQIVSLGIREVAVIEEMQVQLTNGDCSSNLIRVIENITSCTSTLNNLLVDDRYQFETRSDQKMEVHTALICLVSILPGLNLIWAVYLYNQVGKKWNEHDQHLNQSHEHIIKSKCDSDNQALPSGAAEIEKSTTASADSKVLAAGAELSDDLMRSDAVLGEQNSSFRVAQISSSLPASCSDATNHETLDTVRIHVTLGTEDGDPNSIPPPPPPSGQPPSSVVYSTAPLSQRLHHTSALGTSRGSTPTSMPGTPRSSSPVVGVLF
mmetsp:Transcript_18913/g.36774  ORF Transcript_18913/g.36774 Transcript_18913/m.36774 type:complete len:742 (-) Transcript_18913:266-2491(-)